MQTVADSSKSEYPEMDAHPAASEGAAECVVAGSLVAGRYRLDEVIGRGGMATVWRGHDERLGRDVAIKVCPPATAGGSLTIREERLSSTLLHPNIVSIFDAGDISSTDAEAPGSFIIMEYVDGTTAHQLAPVPWREAVGIVRQAAEGLAAAHERGIVHCDVKPGNLLIDRRGRVLVADFGIAMRARSEIGDYVHGSPAYIAPERLAGERADPRVDVYGLGGVLSFLITGQRPAGDAGSLPFDCPREIAGVIARSRAQNPNERYADANEFRAALDLAARASHVTRDDRFRRRDAAESTRRVISHPRRILPAQARQIAQRSASPSPVPLAGRVNGAQPRRPAYRPAHRHRLGTLIAAGVVVLLLLAGGIFLRQIVTIEGVTTAPPPAAAIAMPNVEGETFATAIESLSDRGIVVERVDVIYAPGPINQVVAQNPAPGSIIGDDDSVTLVVRTGR